MSNNSANTTTSKSTSSEQNEAKHPFTNSMSDSLHSSIDRLASTVAKAEENVRDGANAGAENLSARQKQIESKWNESGIKRFAAENPVATAGVAFAAGALISSLLRKN